MSRSPDTFIMAGRLGGGGHRSAVRGKTCCWWGPRPPAKTCWQKILACVFGRPQLGRVPFYINTDAATLLGTDTFVDGAVSLRKGPIYQCAEKGGFGVLDEINMAKNESLAVLHATWTSAGPSTCPATSGSSSTTPPALSPP